jgi:hypothetical protein
MRRQNQTRSASPLEVPRNSADRPCKGYAGDSKHPLDESSAIVRPRLGRRLTGCLFQSCGRCHGLKYSLSRSHLSAILSFRQGQRRAKRFFHGLGIGHVCRIGARCRGGLLFRPNRWRRRGRPAIGIDASTEQRATPPMTGARTRNVRTRANQCPISQKYSSATPAMIANIATFISEGADSRSRVFCAV